MRAVGRNLLLVLLGVVALLLFSSLPSQAGEGKSYGPENPFGMIAMVYLWGITDDPSPWPLVASNDSPVRVPLHSPGPEDGYSLPVIVARPFLGVVIVIWYLEPARPQPDDRGRSDSVVHQPRPGVGQRDHPARGVAGRRRSPIPDRSAEPPLFLHPGVAVPNHLLEGRGPVAQFADRFLGTACHASAGERGGLRREEGALSGPSRPETRDETR